MDRARQLAKWGATDEQVLRITAAVEQSDIDYIREALLVAFSNPRNQDEFMGKRNHNAPFNGMTPLAYLTEDPTRAKRLAEHILTLGAPW